MSKPNRRICVIDDDPDIHRVLEPVFKKSGYDYASALDGASGLALLEEQTFELAIIDGSFLVWLQEADWKGAHRRYRDRCERTILGYLGCR